MRFDKYELQEELGRGSFGTVYKAFDFNLDRIVAIKVLHPNLAYLPNLLEKFEQEARLSAQLSHNNIVPVYDYGQFEGQNFLVMAYMPGGSLRDLLLAKGRLEEVEALQIFNDLIMGVKYAHSKGVVHRDLKPSNILFDDNGIAKITDLGFAKTITVEDSHSMSMSSGIVGTPHYMAPELWEGKKLTQAVDQYSLGCILYEMLAGLKLFEGDTTPIVMTKHFRPVEITADLSKKSTSIIRRLTEKAPEDRYSSVAELQKVLNQPLYLVAPSEEKAAGIPADTFKSVRAYKETEPSNKEESITVTPPKTSLKLKPALRYALIALVVALLLGGVGAVGAKNGWFDQRRSSLTTPAPLGSSTTTNHSMGEITKITTTPSYTPTKTRTSTSIQTSTRTRTPTRTSTPTRTKTPTKTGTPTKLATTSKPQQVTTAPPVVITTEPPVVFTEPPVVTTEPPVVTTEPPVPTRGPTPTPP